MGKPKDTQRILIEISADQDEAIRQVAKNNNMTKINVIRQLCSLLIGMDRTATILVFDKDRIRGLQNMVTPVDFIADPINFIAEFNETKSINMQIAYSQSEGVKVSGLVSVDRKLEV